MARKPCKIGALAARPDIFVVGQIEEDREAQAIGLEGELLGDLLSTKHFALKDAHLLEAAITANASLARLIEPRSGLIELTPQIDVREMGVRHANDRAQKFLLNGGTGGVLRCCWNPIRLSRS